MAGQRVPQQLRAKRTRKRLLSAARRVFANEGYERATIDDVARGAGCSKGAYYFHFASKEEVLLALLDEWTRSWSQRLESAAKGKRSPQAALIALSETLFSIDTADSSERRLLLELWALGPRHARVGQRLGRCYRAWRKLLTVALRRAQQADALPSSTSAETAAGTVLALHQGLMVQACLGEPYRALAREATRTVRALLTGSSLLRRAG